MDDKPKTVAARVLRDFNDAGTATDGADTVERTFKKGAEVQLTEGEIENFAACGLVERIAVEAAPTPATPAEPEGDDTKKPGRRG